MASFSAAEKFNFSQEVNIGQHFFFFFTSNAVFLILYVWNLQLYSSFSITSDIQYMQPQKLVSYAVQLLLHLTLLVFSAAVPVFTYRLRHLKEFVESNPFSSYNSNYFASHSTQPFSLFALQALFKLFYNQLDPTAPSAPHHSVPIGTFKNNCNIHVYSILHSFTMCVYGCAHVPLYVHAYTCVWVCVHSLLVH